MNKRGQLTKKDWEHYPKFGIDTSIMSNKERLKKNGLKESKVSKPSKKK
jgi:hypothetical protein